MVHRCNTRAEDKGLNSAHQMGPQHIAQAPRTVLPYLPHNHAQTVLTDWQPLVPTCGAHTYHPLCSTHSAKSQWQWQWLSSPEVLGPVEVFERGHQIHVPACDNHLCPCTQREDILSPLCHSPGVSPKCLGAKEPAAEKLCSTLWKGS